MTPAQYKQAIASLGLSQERAGVWLGYSGRSSQGWALGEWPVPKVVAMLLNLMASRGLSVSDVPADIAEPQGTIDPPDSILGQR